jgi:hypothetical protein
MAVSAPASAALSFGTDANGVDTFNLCTEDPVTGCVKDLGLNVPITVASDGEATFDPFNAGYDTSDGIQLSNIWVGVQTDGWNRLLDSFTWVLPACDGNGVCENGNVNEPVGIWKAPGYTLVGATELIYNIYEFGGGLSDRITIYNDDGGTASISFNSSPTPEPASWALMITGFGLVGGLARRRVQAATA